MCTRQKAIQFVITNGSGTEDQLVAKITKRQYDEFMSVGLIKKPLRVMSSHSSDIEIEWVATGLAFKRAYELNLRAVRSLKFKTPEQEQKKNRGWRARLRVRQSNEVETVDFQ